MGPHERREGLDFLVGFEASLIEGVAREGRKT
jgi:hypothetical protein